jgi:hypothetical protein
MNLIAWADYMLQISAKYRLKVMGAFYTAVRTFKNGETPTKEGIAIEKLLRSNKVDVIGFVQNVNYIRINSSHKEDLDVIWDHKFSVPSVLFQLKGTPIMLLVNPNVAYNDSRLLEIDENAELEEIRNLKGIIG